MSAARYARSCEAICPTRPGVLYTSTEVCRSRVCERNKRGAGIREPGSEQLETGNWKLGTGNWELGTGNCGKQAKTDSIQYHDRVVVPRRFCSTASIALLALLHSASAAQLPAGAAPPYTVVSRDGRRPLAARTI